MPNDPQRRNLALRDGTNSLQLCCSKKYGNWLLASLGDASPKDMNELHDWGSFFYSGTPYDPEFPIGFNGGGPMLTGNYGRITGPKPADCAKPIPIPLGKTDEFNVYPIGNDIYLDNNTNAIGTNYRIYNTQGQLLKTGKTTKPHEIIFDNSNISHQLIYIQTIFDNNTKTFKINSL